MDNPGSNEFMTPPPELEKARRYMGGITTDPASNAVAQRYVQADYYAISPQEAVNYPEWQRPTEMGIDGLSESFVWRGNIWLNPPYSKGLIDSFTDRALQEWENNDSIVRMLILVNSQTDTKWYHALARASTRVFQYRGRLKFWKIMNGQAYEKWEGEVSIKRRTLDPTIKPKVGNSPRYLNTLFVFEHEYTRLQLFREIYGSSGTILIPER